MNYPIFNAGGAVKNKIQARLTKALISALLGSLLLPIASVGLLHLLPKAAAAGSGSIQVTSNGNYASPCGKGNNFISMGLPSGKEISNASAYTVEAWVKIDIASNSENADCVSVGLGPTEFSRIDGWNQRGSLFTSPARGSFYYVNNSNTVYTRCDSSGTTAADCPAIPAPRGQWTHLAFKKAVVGGNTRIIQFIDGVPLSQRTDSVANAATMMKYIMILG